MALKSQRNYTDWKNRLNQSMKLSIFLEDEIDPVNLSYIDFIFAVMAQLVKYAEFLYIKHAFLSYFTMALCFELVCLLELLNDLDKKIYIPSSKKY